MINLIKEIIKPRYQPLNEIEIISKNIWHNIDYLQSLQTKAEIFPVLKSNAYGHGLKEICKILNKTDIKMVAVDSFPEAQIVYKNFKGQVLILGEMPLKAYKYCKFKRTEFVIYNEKTLKYLSKYGKKIKIHLFVNTGMNREGIDDLSKFINDNKKFLDQVEITGFCSHLAEADNSNSDFNKLQEDRFIEALNDLKNNKIYPKWIHLGNSAAIFNLKNDIYTAFRPGLAFYGYNPLREGDSYYNQAKNNLKPSLRLYSTVVNVHNQLSEGEKVSYAESFVNDNKNNIAVIPFGYFEGLDRRFSNCAKFLFNKNNSIFWAKIAGNVCMNLSCINCFDNKIEIGDKVQIISEINDLENSVENLCKKINIVNYELLCRLNNRIKRKIV